MPTFFIYGWLAWVNGIWLGVKMRTKLKKKRQKREERKKQSTHKNAVDKRANETLNMRSTCWSLSALTIYVTRIPFMYVCTYVRTQYIRLNRHNMISSLLLSFSIVQNYLSSILDDTYIFRFFLFFFPLSASASILWFRRLNIWRVCYLLRCLNEHCLCILQLYT